MLIAAALPVKAGLHIETIVLRRVASAQ